MKPHSHSVDLGLLLLRVMAGAVFIFHGSQKLFGAFGGHGIEGFAASLESLGIPMPQLAAYLSGGTEFFGGLALLLGFATRLVSVPLAFNMFVASFTVHAGKFDGQKGGMEYPLTLAVIALAFVLAGAGAYSVDALLRERHSRESTRGSSTVAPA